MLIAGASPDIQRQLIGQEHASAVVGLIIAMRSDVKSPYLPFFPSQVLLQCVLTQYAWYITLIEIGMMMYKFKIAEVFTFSLGSILYMKLSGRCA